MIVGCIKNDLPYPYIEGLILDMELEGQIGAYQLSATDRTISFEINDSVDLREARILKLLVTENASIHPEEKSCVNPGRFPSTGFSSLNGIPLSADTRFNAENPFYMTIRTYQDYQWKIMVKQQMNRRVAVKNQVGEMQMDEYNRNVIVYVSSDQPLDQIEIVELKLGLAGAEIQPLPTAVHNFTYPQTFYIYNKNREPERWILSIFHTSTVVATKSASAWATKASLSGEMKAGSSAIPTFKYRRSDVPTYTSVPAADIKIAGGVFSADIVGLTPGTTYFYKACLGSNEGIEKSFQTEEMIQIPNLSFENWNKEGTTWFANTDQTAANYWWDSGNKGTNVLGEKNPTSPEYTDVVKGTAVRLASTAVVGVFAAGSIYTGQFSKIVGLGAELKFGRPYQVRPTALKGYYKYAPGTIDKAKEPYLDLLGKKDTCYIYVALFDWTEPFVVNTTEKKFITLNPSNPNLIALGELKSSRTDATYQEMNIPLIYYKKTTKPTHILIVAAASKYGDYFTGSTQSTLLIDEFELLF